MTTSETTSAQYLYIEQNQAIRYDNLIGSFFGYTNETYISSKPAVVSYTHYNYTELFGTLTFEMSPNVNTVERRVTTFIDAIQKIGGLFGAISAFVLFISLKVQKVLYTLELVRNTVIDIEEKQSSLSYGDKEFSDKIVDRERNTKRLNFKFNDWLCRRLGSKEKRKKLEQAMDQIREELDVYRYIKNMRTLEFITDILFNKDEKSLFKFSKFNQLYPNYKVNKEKETSVLGLKIAAANVQQSKRKQSKAMIKEFMKQFEP
mmetsp:Transcript_16907/g.16157  ORF Transcript_16907/g.16157 Transcript_16907/m.16157 type:complete len:261 (+) Transcript_16907:613-1395(+)